jgi:chemotaxis protein MotB
MAAGGGGSWKVAYADFVTAMMALFMVLWITNQDESVKGAVQEYFKNPWKAALKDSVGIIPVKDADVMTSRKANFEGASAVQLDALRRINEDWLRAFVQNPEYRENKSLYTELTEDGLYISFLDHPTQPIFKENSDEFTKYGELVFDTVAWEIARYPSTEIELEGHTGKSFRAVDKNFGSWEVSTARANTARKRLLNNGVKESQIKGIGGFAATKPLRNKKAEDAMQSRVTVLIRAKTDLNVIAATP